jgi:hypothetical protein
MIKIDKNLTVKNKPQNRTKYQGQDAEGRRNVDIRKISVINARI